MDRKKFNEVIIEVITSVVTKIPSFKRIRIIADVAGGHSLGKGTHYALNKSLTDARKWIIENSAPGKFLFGNEIYFLLQPAQFPDLNMLDLGAWWSLETAVNELHYDPAWNQRTERPSELLRDLNETVLKTWTSWSTSEILAKLQSTLIQNYWSTLKAKGRNVYERHSALPSPTLKQLADLLDEAKTDPLWSETA